MNEETARGTVLGTAARQGDYPMTAMLLRRNAHPEMKPPLTPICGVILSRNAPVITGLLKYGAKAHGLAPAAVTTTRWLTPACRNLLQAWPVQHYEQYVKTLRSTSSDTSQKAAALFSALRCANEHGHQEVHALFMGLAN